PSSPLEAFSSTTTSGVIPIPLIHTPDGVKYRAVVKRKPDPSGNGITDCTEPLPKDLTPTNTALLLSRRAPATISLPEAEPSLIITTIGQSRKSPPLFS